jgi:hypothetical protein
MLLPLIACEEEERLRPSIMVITTKVMRAKSAA